jgi:hypothetical protein
MDDRELLTLAAKAAGVKYYGQCDDGTLLLEGLNPDNVDWNPLTDDGDAFRLQCVLWLSVAVMNEGVEAPFTAACNYRKRARAHELHGDNCNAATRRAITRAAAEIGKTM